MVSPQLGGGTDAATGWLCIDKTYVLTDLYRTSTTKLYIYYTRNVLKTTNDHQATSSCVVPESSWEHQKIHEPQLQARAWDVKKPQTKLHCRHTSKCISPDSQPQKYQDPPGKTVPYSHHGTFVDSARQSPSHQQITVMTEYQSFAGSQGTFTVLLCKKGCRDLCEKHASPSLINPRPKLCGLPTHHKAPPTMTGGRLHSLTTSTVVAAPAPKQPAQSCLHMSLSPRKHPK